MVRRMALAVVISFVCVSLVFAADTLLIDDFNSAEKPNRIGGDLGVWNKDPEDASQGCAMTFDGAVKNKDKGYSLKLEYDVDSPNAAYCGYWTKLQKADFSKRKNLVINIKGDEKTDFTTQVKLELKNSRQEAGTYLLSGISKNWKEFVIPLSEFNGLTDLSSMEEFVITFDDINVTVKKGCIYVDDISVN